MPKMSKTTTVLEAEYLRFLGKLSENVRRVRNKKGLTQEDMLAMGFERRWFQRIESGTYSISLPTLFRLSQALKVDIEEFFK
jgi:transcriptional regulator with XRE-family HTH domain